MFANAFAQECTLPDNFSDSAVIENLQDTNGFAFSPDGRMFISERITGKLQVAKFNTATDSWSLNATPFYTFDTPRDTSGNPEALRSAGLRDITFDPDFAINGFVYAFYMNDDTRHNRVVRIKADAANPDVADASFNDGVNNDLDSADFNNKICRDSDADMCDDCNVGDADDDNDGILDVLDNCPLRRNPLQQDSNANGIGDACDSEAEFCIIVPVQATTMFVTFCL